ncbi:MAG: SRPBCC family protein [Lacisediminihabitans sp.]
MATNNRTMKCTPTEVFEVLADGWLYPSWVVGASRIRGVDGNWPAPGSRIFHSFGIWPALINDTTSVLEWDSPRHARLKARAWPTGEAEVIIDVRPRGTGCNVRLIEDATSGPALLVPTGVRNLALHYRNHESLHRLAYLAERGATARERN